MSVKCTRFITRWAAEERVAQFRAAEAIETERERARQLSDQELEDELEQLTDAAHGGEGFENYLIKEI